MVKRQICVQVDEDIAKKMETIRDETGIPISRQIELKLKGFEIAKIKKEDTVREGTIKIVNNTVYNGFALITKNFHESVNIEPISLEGMKEYKIIIQIIEQKN